MKGVEGVRSTSTMLYQEKLFSKALHADFVTEAVLVTLLLEQVFDNDMIGT